MRDRLVDGRGEESETTRHESPSGETKQETEKSQISIWFLKLLKLPPPTERRRRKTRRKKQHNVHHFTLVRLDIFSISDETGRPCFNQTVGFSDHVMNDCKNIITRRRRVWILQQIKVAGNSKISKNLIFFYEKRIINSINYKLAIIHRGVLPSALSRKI